MHDSFEAQIAALRKRPAAALRERYRELFGEESRSSNRQFLFRRVAWRLQALAQGDLSERARKRAGEIANDADVKIQPAKTFLKGTGLSERDPRLPPTGTILRRTFKGAEIRVTVLDLGFEYAGRRYSSLSAIASEIAGSRWNGFSFFRIGVSGEDA